ncbi:MAG: phage portal protein [Pseudomonadota bacterium]
MFGLKQRAKQAAPDRRGAALADLVSLHSLGAARWSGRDAASLATTGFKRNVVAYRCVQMIADAASSVQFTVCQQGDRLSDHPLCQLLAAPNPDQSGQSLFESLYGHLQINGNAYLEIIAGQAGPAALYLLRPDRVEVEVGRDGWPAAYIYRTSQGRRRITRRPDGTLPILHLKLFNPVDEQYGQSPLQVAGNAVDLHNASVEWNKSLIDNAARPSGALIYHGVDGATSLTGDQFDRLKGELDETFQGSRHAGRPMVLDGGLDWKPMSLSPAEMDFMSLKNSAARDIALAFGVPPMLLGIPGDNTYSNYREANLSFWRQTILPVVSKVARVLTKDLAEDTIEVSYDIDGIDALQEQRNARLDTILSTDVITDEEKRMALGYPSEPEAR